jgi:hypothetical protein
VDGIVRIMESEVVLRTRKTLAEANCVQQNISGSKCNICLREPSRRVVNQSVDPVWVIEARCGDMYREVCSETNLHGKHI